MSYTSSTLSISDFHRLVSPATGQDKVNNVTQTDFPATKRGLRPADRGRSCHGSGFAVMRVRIFDSVGQHMAQKLASASLARRAERLLSTAFLDDEARV